MKQLSKYGSLKFGSMVIIKRIDKSTLKSRINYQSNNYQSNICIDLTMNEIK